MLGRALFSEEDFKTLPKAELHLHLGGAFPLEYLRSIASDQDFNALEKGLDWIAGRVPYEEGFQVFNLVGRIVNTEEKLEEGTAALCRELAKDGVVYAEIRTSLKDLGKGYEAYLKAVLRGIQKGRTDRFEELLPEGRRFSAPEKGEKFLFASPSDSSLDSVLKDRDCAELPVQAKILLSLWRSSSFEQAKRTVDLALKYKEVVGLDISGDSTIGAVEKILPELLRAKREGLFLTLHLGESPKERDQRELLEILNPDRIGHGVFLSEEAKEWILEKKIPIEMCLSSGFLVQMIHEYSSHPALQYFLNGHPVSICTDDPLIFRTSLTKECRLLQDEAGFSVDLAKQMIQVAFDSAFLSEEEKKDLKSTMLYK